MSGRAKRSRPPKKTSIGAKGFGLVFALLLGGLACQSQDEVILHLRSFEQEAMRHQWSCEAMAASLEAWLEENESMLQESVAGAVDPPNLQFSDGGRRALAKCADQPRVQRALVELASILEPLR